MTAKMFGHLTICDSSGRSRLQYKITQQFTYVGKDKDCDIRIENPNCAGKQFLLTANGNRPVKIQNLSKKYATLVNQKPIGFQVDYDLNEQDTISAGGQRITWSYKISDTEDLPQNGGLKRTRNSEPVRKVAVITPNRREMTVDEEEGVPLKRRRRTLYESAVHSYTPHLCSNIAFLPDQSSFARRISYDRMLKGKTSRGRLSSGATPRRLAGSLKSPSVVYNHDTAFNKSITPRTFYSGRSSNAPFTFRGFNPAPEESNSVRNMLPDDSSFLNVTESNAHGRRSGRVLTPIPKKRLTSSFHSARTPRNRILTGTPSAYFPTIQEGRLIESAEGRSPHIRESYLYDDSRTLGSRMNIPEHSRSSTPASYFSPTSSGSPRMMRAESPNIQLNDVSGMTRSSFHGRRSFVSSDRSTPYGTPLAVFHESQQHDSLFVNTSGSSQLRLTRSQGSFLVDQNHYGSHDSILQSPQPQTFDTPARLNTPRRSRIGVETPGSSTFSPMSYNDTDYVLLSPRGRDIVSKRYGRSEHSNVSQSPYSPSQNTLDFTPSPPLLESPRFARTPKRSLSVHVLTKSLKKNVSFYPDRSSASSPKGRKSRRKSQAISEVSRASTSVLTTPSKDASTGLHIANEESSSNPTARQQRIVKRSDTSIADSVSEPSNRKTSKRGMVEDNLPSQVSRRSHSVPSDSPVQLKSTRKSRKSGTLGPEEISTSVASPTPQRPEVFTLETDSDTTVRKSRPSKSDGSVSIRTSRRSLSLPSETLTRSSSARKSKEIAKRVSSGTPTKLSSARKSRKSGMGSSEGTSSPLVSPTPKTVPSSTPAESSSARRSRKSGMGNTSESILPNRLNQSEENLSPRVPRRSVSAPSGLPTKSSSARKSRKSGIGSTEGTLEPSISPTAKTVPSGPPAQSGSTRRPKKSGMGRTEDTSESIMPNRLCQSETNLPRVSRRSQSVPSGTPTQSSSARRSRKSGSGSTEDISAAIVPLTPKTSPSATPAKSSSARRSRRSGVGRTEDTSESVMANRLNQSDESLSRVSRGSQSVPSGTPAKLSSARKSRKSGTESTEETLELGVSPMPKKLDHGEGNLSLVSRRSQSVPSGTTSQSSSAPRSRKSGRACIGGSSESKMPSRLNQSEENLSPRVSRRSQSDPSGTPTKSSSARKSRKSGLGSTEGTSAAIVPPTPKTPPSGPPTRSSSGRRSRRSGMGNTEGTLELSVSPMPKRLDQGEENLSRVSRRSQSVPSGTPALSSAGRRSRKSGRDSTEDPSESKMPNRLNQSEENLSPRVSRRSQSVPSGTPAKSSSARKSRKSGMRNTEDALELNVSPLPKRLDQGEDNISPPVSRRFQNVPPGSQDHLNSPRKSRISGTGSPKENSKLPPTIVIVPPTPDSKPPRLGQGKVISSPRVSLRSSSGSPRSPAPMNFAQKSRKSGDDSPGNVPQLVALQTPRRSGTLKLESHLESSRFGEDEPNTLSASTGKERASRNLTETSISGDIKPVVGENGSIEWPQNISATLRASGRQSRGSSVLLDQSASFDPSTSIADISAIPRSSRRTHVVFSTPAPSNSKKSVKVTSTPFPKGLISRQGDTPEISAESTLPLEIDTISAQGRYISSDSPDYDKITDEESFDVTDVPGTSARTSLIQKTTKVKSKRSVSFVAVQSGVTNKESKTVTIKKETISPDRVTPPKTLLEVNLRSSRKMSTTKKPSPNTPLTAGKTSRMEGASRLDNRLAKSLSEGSLLRVVSPDKHPVSSSPLATSLNNLTSVGASRSLENSEEIRKRNSRRTGKSDSRSSIPVVVGTSPTTSKPQGWSEPPGTPISSVSRNASERITPPKTVSPEVVLRSSRKSARRSTQLLVPGTPTSAFRKNPRRTVKKPSPSAQILKRKLSSMRTPGGSAVKKLKLDPDKPDKKKMAALWVCHKKKSPSKSPLLPEQNSEMRRSFDLASPTKYNTTVPSNFKFQTVGSASSSSGLEESHFAISGKQLTPIKDLDLKPQQSSPEDDLLNALDLSRKSDIIVEPQKPSRRLRSSTQRSKDPAVSSASNFSGPEKISPPKSVKKLLFKSPLVEYEGSQPRGEPQVKSSNMKSILMQSPTTSSDEPMSRVFTTSPVVDYTDSHGKKKIFRASPTSMSGGIRELIPSDEIDLTGVRDLFERNPSPSSAAAAPSPSRKRGQKDVAAKDDGVSPPKVTKVSPAATSSRRKRGAIETNVIGEINMPSSSKSPVRKLRHGTVSQSTKAAALPIQKATTGKAKKVKEAKLETSFETPPRANTKENETFEPVLKVPSRRGKVQPRASLKVTKAARVSVPAAKTAIRNKAVGRIQSRKVQVVASSEKQLSDKFTSKITVKKASPVKNDSKKASKGTPVKASPSSPKKAPGKKPSKKSPVVASPKKLRSNKAGASKERGVKAPASKQSPKKNTASKNVPIPKQTRKKLQAAASPKKLRFTETPKKASATKKDTGNASEKIAVKASTSKESPKKISATTRNASKKAAMKATFKESPKNVSAVTKNASKRPLERASPSKGSSRKASSATRAAVKAATSKGSSKKPSSPQEVATPKQSSVVKSAPKKASRRAAVKVAVSKESPNEAVPKSTNKKASAPKKQKASGRKSTNKPRDSLSKKSTPRSPNISPRKTRSGAKPKKPSPKKSAVVRKR